MSFGITQKRQTNKEREGVPTGLPHEEYLSVRQLAERLDLAPKTIRNKVSAGIFKKNVHYFTPPGLDGPRFKWSAICAWLEGKEEKAPEIIPLSKGTVLRIPNNGL